MANNTKNSSGDFKEKASTSIWQEIASENNPYIPQKCHLHGYDIMQLCEKKKFVDVLYLLFQSEFPTKEQSRLLETLMIACINLGSRHPATRAAMNAGVSKTNPEHILPIGLMVLGGGVQGAIEVEKAMQFLCKHSNLNPGKIAEDLLTEERKEEGDWHIVPGFGSYYGGINLYTAGLAESLLQLPACGKFLKWGQKFVQRLEKDQLGWLITGVAAATLLDLGIKPREGAGLFQFMCAPGLLAHGLEQTHKPIHAMPLLEDENYVVRKR